MSLPSIIHGFFDWIGECYDNWPTNDKMLFFRGHADSEWKLLPSVFRNPDLDLERRVLLDFKQVSVAEMDYQSKIENILVEMQHCGIPTRLLDWTLNAMVALFFACQHNINKKGEETDGCVYCLNPWKAYHIITSRIECQHSQMMDILKESRMKLAQGWTFRDISNYINLKYKYEIEWEALRAPIPCIGRYMVNRVQSQKGAFLIWGDGDAHSFAPGLHVTLDRYVDYDECIKEPFVIPVGEKKSIIDFLRKLDITNFTLYPDNQGMAKEVNIVNGIFKIK